MAKQTWNEPIGRNVDWGGDASTQGKPVSGAMVQKFIKDSLDDKMSCAIFNSSDNTQYIFKDEEDKLAWLNGDTTVPFKTCKFDFAQMIRQMTVVNYMDSKSLYYTQVSESAMITVGFKSEEKGITETSWKEVLEDAYITVAVDRGFTGAYTTIIDSKLVISGNTLSFDVLKYLATGNNRVRVTVEGAETGATGSIVYTALLTTMYLAPSNFKWNVPFVEGSAYSLGGVNIGGNIDKKLKIKVSNEQTYSKLYEVNIGTQTYTGIAYFYDGLEFPTEGTGVYNVEMWLDANGLESEHLHYNIICIAKDDVKTAQLIAISDVPSTVKNYDTNSLFSYVIYNGGATSASPVLNVSAIINNTPTPIVRDEVLENVATGEVNTYVIDLEVDTQESNVQLYASIGLGDSKQEAIYAIDNSASFPAVAGAVFYMNPANRNNAQPNKMSIVNESNLASSEPEYAGTWTNVSFTDGMDGWTVDNYGRKCLRIPATSKVSVDYTPFANATTRTIEISYRVENTSNYNEDIISLASEITSNFVGARIKPTNVLLHSSLLKTDDLMQGYNTKDEELVHLMITIVQNYKRIGNLAQIYVNGVKKCSFEWSAGDTFAHNGTLLIGSDTADLYIYKMRVYTSAFEWPAVIQNFISCLPDTPSKKAAYERVFEVINDGYQLDFDKVKNGGFNYFVLRLPNGKSLPSILSQNSVSGTRLEINIQQNPSFVINGLYEDETTEGQGTTAMNYFRWNLRWKTERIRVTAKKNFASSMHSHKMGATALFNDLNRMIVGPNEADARVAVEQYGAYGFLEVPLEGTTDQFSYVPIGLYTIGQDKGDKATFGYNNKDYKDTLIHLEGTDHSPKAVGMDYPWQKLSVATNTDGDANLGVVKKDGSVIAAWEIGACGSAESDPDMLAYLAEEFKPAYDMDYRNTSMLVALEAGTSIGDINANLSTFRAMETDLGFTNADCLLWIDGEYETYYYDVIEEKYVKDGLNILDDLGITASDLTGATAHEKNLEIRRMRMERYRAQMEDYWHLRDNLFHYCFIILFAATDNFKKNTYPYKFGTLESGSRWRWRQDDLDTLFDINNQGLANKIYSILNGDKSGTTHLFRGNTSYHWTNIQFYYENEIKGMMLEILTAMASLSDTGNSLIEKAVGCVRKYFWNKAQDYFTESAYNIDAEWSYEEAWAAMKNGTYAAPVHPLQQSLGSHYEAEVAWVELRFLFMASLFGFGAFAVGNDSDTTLGQISFRPAQGDNTFRLTPAVNMNPTILVGDSDAKSAGKRLLAGETAEIVISTDGDTSIYIQGADQLSDIGDFSKVNLYAENPALTVQSKRLQRLKVGDENAENVTTVLKTLNVLSCPSMSEVDARNVSTLTGTIDLSKCPRLVRALFGGSGAGEVILPNGSKIEELELPDSLTNLSLVNLPNLDVDGLKYGDLTALTYLRLENNPNIGGYALLKATFEDGAPLTNIRVIGFDHTGDATDAALLATLANGEYFGIDSDGTRNPNIIPVLEGTLNLTTPIYEDDYNAIQAAYGAGLVLNLTKGFYVKIKDPEVFRVLLEKITTDDGVGLTREDIEGVTSIDTWFKGNTEIQIFDELQHFTNVVALAASSVNYTGAFEGCSNLMSIDLSNIKTLGSKTFLNCTSLESVGNLDKVETIIGSAFSGCTKLAVDIHLPSLRTLNLTTSYGGTNVFTNSGIISFKAENLNDTIIGQNTFRPSDHNGFFAYCLSLKSVDWGKGTNLGSNMFAGCESLEDVKGLQDVVEIGYNAFYKCTSLQQRMYFPKCTSMLGSTSFGACATFMDSAIESFDAPLLQGIYEGNSSASAFRNCLQMTSVNIPSVANIGAYTFYGCTALAEANFSSVANIGAQAFYNCTSLSFEELNLPNLTSLGQNAFYGVKIRRLNLGSLTAWPSFTNTSQNFGNKSVLEELIFSDEVTNIPQYFLSGYSKVAEVNLENVTTLAGNALRSSGLVRAVLPNLITLGGSDFRESSNLEMVELGAGLTSSMSWTFYQCKKLATLIMRATTPPTADANTFSGTKLSSGVIFVPAASIPSYAAATNWSTYASRLAPLEDHEDGGWVKFADSAVEAICVENWDTNGSGYMSKNECEAVTTIHQKFSGNTEIKSFDELAFFTNVKSLYLNAFKDCTQLQSINLNNITSLGNGTLLGTGLLSINLPLIEVIGENVMSSIPAKVIRLGPNVSKIGSYSCRYNTSLEAYICEAETPPTLGNLVFQYSVNFPIYVPDASVDAYKEASGWAAYADRIKPLSEYTE